MERISIKVSVDKERAAAAGFLDYGESEYRPTQDEWGSLSAEQRVWLASGKFGPDSRFTTGVLKLTTSLSCWVGIVEAADRDMTAQAADRAKLDAEKEVERVKQNRRVEEYCAKSDDDLLAKSYGDDDGGWVIKPTIWDYGYDLRNDERVIARQRALVPELERRRIEYREAAALAKAEADRREAEAAAAKEAAKERALAGFRRLAMDMGGAAARSADDGYEFVGHVVDGVLAKLAEGSRAVLVDGTHEYKTAAWEERKNPSATAFEVLDLVAAGVKGATTPVGMEVTVTKIMRFWPDNDEDTDCITAVLMFLEAPVMQTRVVVFRAE